MVGGTDILMAQVDLRLNLTDVLSNSTYVSSRNLDVFAQPTSVKVWGIGLLFVTIISLCAAVGIALMPCLNAQTYNKMLTYFVGLGVGSLSGSAVFHLLPQAFGLVDAQNDDAHLYLAKSFVAIFGIFQFFIVDMLLKVIMEYRKKKKNERKAIKLIEELPKRIEPKRCELIPKEEGGTNRKPRVHKMSWSHHANFDPDEELVDDTCAAENNLRFPPLSQLSTDNQTLTICNHQHDHEHITETTGAKKIIATVAWMIIFGDGLHNFIDGLSMGASFSVDILSGIGVSVAVLCEEFPHELGDVAILIASGMTIRQALVYNLLSAATCYVGFVLGVLVGELNEASTYIFALAGGTFLYISLGNMVPEMNRELDRAIEKNIRNGVGVFLLQTFGIFTGLITMFIMAFYGSQINFS